MNTFSIVRDALKATENDPSKEGLDAATVEAGRVIAAVQKVVDALTPPTGGRYVVAFADIQTAGTYIGEHRIVVSSKPLRDPSLTLVEKAVVIATFTAHEIGHTYVTTPRKLPVDLVGAHNPHSGYKSVQNIADDIILEPFMVERFPILADAFEFTGLWVLRTTAVTPLPIRDVLNRETTPAARFNILTHATRYGDIPEIEWVEDNVRAERDWARDWKRRLLLVPLLDHTAFLAMCDEFWDRVRLVDETEPEPEPLGGSEEGTNENESDEDGDGEGEGSDDDSDEGEGDEPGGDPGEGGNDFDDDTEGDEPGEGDGDEDGDDGEGEAGDEPGGDTGDGDSESESEDGEGEGDGESGSGDGEGESHGGDWDGESDDSDHDGDEDPDRDGEGGEYTGHDGDGDPDSDKAGGGGNAEANSDSATLRDEDDFDQTEVDETTHDSAEQTDTWSERDEERVRTYDSTTSTRFGAHGSLPTSWD